MCLRPTSLKSIHTHASCASRSDRQSPAQQLVCQRYRARGRYCYEYLPFKLILLTNIQANYWWGQMHCGPPNQNFGWAMAHAVAPQWSPSRERIKIIRYDTIEEINVCNNVINRWNYFPFISMNVITIHNRYRRTDGRTDDILVA